MTYILFLHGAGTSDKDITKYLSDLLNKHQIQGYSFNFTGHGGNKEELAKSSLEKRLIEAEQAIADLSLDEPINLCGSSMGGYIAIKLLERKKVANLVLFAPAVYSVDAFSLPFDSSFSEVIRQKESWKKSDAFKLLEVFTGKVIIFIGDKDEVIPTEVIDDILKSLPRAKSKEVIRIPDCPHKIHLWLSQNKEWANVVADKISNLIRE